MCLLKKQKQPATVRKCTLPTQAYLKLDPLPLFSDTQGKKLDEKRKVLKPSSQKCCQGRLKQL